MKYSLFILFSLIISLSSMGQTDETVNTKEDFKEMSKMSSMNSRNTGYQSLQSLSNTVTKGSQFFNPSWSKGSVTSLDGSTVTNNYFFMYDKVRQELFIKEKGSEQILQGEKNQITGFTLNTDKVHSFAPAHIYDKENNNDFFEVLVKNDAGITLLKKINTKYFPVDKSDIMKVKSGDFSDEYRDDIKYYISIKKGIPEEFKLREKSIKKVLPETKQIALSQYFKENSGEINDNYLIDLFQTLNK